MISERMRHDTAFPLHVFGSLICVDVALCARHWRRTVSHVCFCVRAKLWGGGKGGGNQVQF